MALLSLSTLIFIYLTRLTLAAYTLQDDYSGSNFFSQFTFFTDADPTNGYVDYIGQSPAQSLGLATVNGGAAHLGVDSKNKASGRGRKAVRISSNKSYENGLFVVDVGHMPVGCGTWPAFWLLGPDWPNHGEIDIIEGVSLGTLNKNSLHTSSGCTISSGGNMKGTVGNTECASSNTGGNEGCGVDYKDSTSYGPGLNQAGGGTYATLVTSSTIKIWFWPSGSVPSDATGASPKPASWGQPTALFSGCNIKQHFKSMQIIINTTFCGDWAGKVWSSDEQCSAKANDCESYVQNNPGAFENAFWTINALKVYGGSEEGGDAGTAAGGEGTGDGQTTGNVSTGQNTGNGENTGNAQNTPQTTAQPPAAVDTPQPSQASSAQSQTTSTSSQPWQQWQNLSPQQTGQPSWDGGRGGWGDGGGWIKQKRGPVPLSRRRSEKRHLSGHARGVRA